MIPGLPTSPGKRYDPVIILTITISVLVTLSSLSLWISCSLSVIQCLMRRRQQCTRTWTDHCATTGLPRHTTRTYTHIVTCTVYMYMYTHDCMCIHVHVHVLSKITCYCKQEFSVSQCNATRNMCFGPPVAISLGTSTPVSQQLKLM